MIGSGKFIPLNHGREYLRQHYAVDAGLEPMDFRLFGSVPDGDPDTRRFCIEAMDRCRERAQEELSGCIAGGKISVWRGGELGEMQVAAPQWAADYFDGKVEGSHALYVNREDMFDLLQALTSEASREALAARRAGAETEKLGALNPDAIRWTDYSEAELPELERIESIAANDLWWTWPEALAWIAERDTRNIATLRYWGIKWKGDGDPRINIGAQHLMASRYGASEIQPERELRAAIEAGKVATAGRTGRDSPSSPLNPHIWRGGKVSYPDGVASLVSERSPLMVWAFDIAVARADLVTAFPTFAAVKSKKVRGRAKGSGSFAIADAPLIAEMRALIACGKALTPHGAAVQLAENAVGGGTLDSRITRLANRYRELERKSAN